MRLIGRGSMNSGFTQNGGVSLQGGYQDNNALPSSRSARCVRVGAVDKEPAKPTLFLARLYEMVEDPSTDAAIKWNRPDFDNLRGEPPVQTCQCGCSPLS